MIVACATGSPERSWGSSVRTSPSRTIVATLTSIADTTLVRTGYIGEDDVITVLNAANGVRGAGAAFDFSDALGTMGYLEPGAVTAPVELRLRLATPTASALRLRLLVTAQSAVAPPSKRSGPSPDRR